METLVSIVLIIAAVVVFRQIGSPGSSRKPSDLNSQQNAAPSADTPLAGSGLQAEIPLEFQAPQRSVFQSGTVYSGGDQAYSFSDRVKRELQMSRHRQKVEAARREEQQREAASARERAQADARRKQEETKARLQEQKRKKEEEEREKSLKKAKENATDSPEEAAEHAHAADSAIGEGHYYVDISDCLDEVYRLMICGPDTEPSTVPGHLL